jgi:hypothetical protein
MVIAALTFEYGCAPYDASIKGASVDISAEHIEML